ncbi:hypothetical protein RIF29_25488 [Crotalaria pallida]|uniref:Uncharacterized protein n=1 Tax=Crotalaria pallida TaxID=3830 RepID=A0AAN9EMI0_CROPI
MTYFAENVDFHVLLIFTMVWDIAVYFGQSELPVKPEFIVKYGPKGSFVGGPTWSELKKKFGIRHGQTVDFYYLGGQRFKLIIEVRDGVVYPHVTEQNDDEWFAEEDEEEEDGANDATGKVGGQVAMDQGQSRGTA